MTNEMEGTSHIDPRPAMRAKAAADGVSPDELERFLSNTEFELDSGCLKWTRGKTAGGYGQVRWRGEPRYAHHIGYELGHGPIPDGLFVLHAVQCRHRSCVSPAHLRAGTHAENMADAVAAGTAGRPAGRVLTDRQIAEVQGLHVLGVNATEIKRETGVGFSTIRRVKAGTHRPDAASDELDRTIEAERTATDDTPDPA